MKNKLNNLLKRIGIMVKTTNQFILSSVIGTHKSEFLKELNKKSIIETANFSSKSIKYEIEKRKTK